MEKLNKITEKIIGCAIEVHKNLGPGLLESIYEKALCFELDVNNLKYKNQVLIPVNYKGHPLGEYRLDLLVEDAIIVELKAVEKMGPIFDAQILSEPDYTTHHTRESRGQSRLEAQCNLRHIVQRYYDTENSNQFRPILGAAPAEHCLLGEQFFQYPDSVVQAQLVRSHHPCPLHRILGQSLW